MRATRSRSVVFHRVYDINVGFMLAVGKDLTRSAEKGYLSSIAGRGRAKIRERGKADIGRIRKETDR